MANTPTAPAAGFAFEDAPKLKESPKLRKERKAAAPNPLADRIDACVRGKAFAEGGHTDGLILTGTVATSKTEDGGTKTVLTGNAKIAADFVRSGAARYTDSNGKAVKVTTRIRPLGPGKHIVGDEEITVPAGKVAVYFTVRKADVTVPTAADVAGS